MQERVIATLYDNLAPVRSAESSLGVKLRRIDSMPSHAVQPAVMSGRQSRTETHYLDLIFRKKRFEAPLDGKAE